MSRSSSPPRRDATIASVVDAKPAGSVESGRNVAARPKVMLVAKGFPNSSTAGNLTYLDSIVRFLEAENVDFRLVVVGDRFPHNEFYYRCADAPGRLDRLAFAHGVRIGNGLALRPMRSVGRNAVRRVAMALPAPVTRALTSWYFKANNASTFDAFLPLAPADLHFAVDEITRFRPDYLFVDTIRLSEIVEATKAQTGRTCVIMYDLATARLRSLGRVARLLPGHEQLALAQLEARFEEIEREEFRRLALCDDILAIQQQEAACVAKKLPDQRVIHLPMAASGGSHPSLGAPLRRRCLFVGSQGDANVQGMRWFLGEIWPLVLAAVPDAVLDVCGTCCAYLEASDASVRLRGRVESLDAFYEQADVCVIPLLAGSGMKIKIVDALSRGCACVTTSVGMQGLEHGAGSAFLHADTGEPFVEAVVSLMRDQGKRDALRRDAASFMARHFSAESIFDELRTAIRTL